MKVRIRRDGTIQVLFSRKDREKPIINVENLIDRIADARDRIEATIRLAKLDSIRSNVIGGPLDGAYSPRRKSPGPKYHWKKSRWRFTR